MANVDGRTTGMAGVQPIVMTTEQFNQLGQLIATNHADSQNFQKLQQAAAGIDRCDGLVPEHVRTWIRALDGWQSEKVTDAFMMDLAKSTTAGDLLEDIRTRTNDATDGGLHAIDDWHNLRAHVVEHFLSACEDIKLQTQLESTRQRMGETTPAYIRRYRADARRAYGVKPRAATEESRVVASFLRGLTDRQFAERMYRTGRVTTLDAAVKTALEKEAERERMEQMLRSRGEEPMEVGAVEATGRLIGLMDKMQRSIEQVTTRLSKIEARKEAQPAPRPQQVAPKQQRRDRKSGRRPDHKWDDKGRPICNSCGKSGHVYRECPARRTSVSLTSGGQ